MPIVTPIMITGIAKTTVTVADLSSQTKKGFPALRCNQVVCTHECSAYTQPASAFRELPWNREGNSYKLFLAERNLSQTK